MTLGIGFNISTGSWSGLATNMGAHALKGGLLAEFSGGDFGHGFRGAAFNKISGIAIANSGVQSIPGQIALEALAGGLIAEATGGKFANGAASAAIQFAFNQVMLIATTDPGKESPANAWEDASETASRMAKELCPECDIETRAVYTVSQLEKYFSEFSDIRGIYIIGHSGPTAIYVGSEAVPDSNLGVKEGRNTRPVDKFQFGDLHPLAEINVWGCNAGESIYPRNIAQAIADRSSRIVHAWPDTVVFGSQGAYVRWWNGSDEEIRFFPRGVRE